MKSKELLFLVIGFLLILACSKDEPAPAPVTIISVSQNGSSLSDGANNIPVDATITLVFSTTLNTANFESAFSINPAIGGTNIDIDYTNQASRVILTLNLSFQTTYTLRINNTPIGQNGEQLENAFALSFTTAADGTITSLPACTSASNECLQTVSLNGDAAANFQFYSSFPIYEEMAKWEELTAAIIVIHGVNRNANDYFSYMMSTLQADNLEEKTILISPFFKIESEAAPGEFYWGSSGWRDGKNTTSTAKISSFAVIDQLIDQLADKSLFPVLTDIIITGHSSGGLFTHLYAAANQAANNHPELTFNYVVANSQYFYYPDGRRLDEGTNQLYSPSGCTGYNIWPLGYNITPPYLSTTDQATYNDQFVNRPITYLLGNGTGPDGSLNTTDCSATLLGSSRFKRGENMFRYMELVYPGTHQHTTTIVEGIGHNGQGMYSSSEFRALLENLLD